MFPTKAPGPDGFPAYFFQRHWDVCGEDVTRVVLNIFRGNESAECINETILVIANRLKQILPDVISEEQTAFVSRRLINDNIILAYEFLHFMKRSKSKGIDVALSSLT
jgi:hypothetical protein